MFGGLIKGIDVIWASELPQKDRLNSKVNMQQYIGTVWQRLHSGN